MRYAGAVRASNKANSADAKSRAADQRRSDMTKSKIAVGLSLFTWLVFYYAAAFAIGDPHPDSPPDVYSQKDLYLKCLIASVIILFIASIVFSIWGYKKDRIFSLIAFLTEVSHFSIAVDQRRRPGQIDICNKYRWLGLALDHVTR